MKVADVMSRGVDPVDPAATVQSAATQMAELDVGAVLVGGETGLEGILTDRDIILRLVVDGRSPADVAVREIMSSTLFSCSEDDPVESAFAQMRERQIRRMPVYSAAGRAVGIVTLSDLAKAVESPEQLKETMRDLSEPHRRRGHDDPADAGEASAAGADAAAPADTAASRTS